MNDTKTQALFNADLAGPVPAKPTKKELAAARAARYAEKHGRPITVYLPSDVIAAIESRGKKADVLEKLVRTQLMRKR